MNIPFLILSYGDFQQTKRLFSTEEDGVQMFPIFHNHELAARYVDKMNKAMSLPMEELLTIQICTERKHALHLLEAILTYGNIIYVIYDPTPPAIDDEKCNAKDIQIARNIVQIDEIIGSLRENGE